MNPPRPDITYSLAVHNSAAFMEDHVRSIAARCATFASAEIVLVENGSSDGSLEVARRLAAELSNERLVVRVDSVPKGLGNAHRRGLALSRGRHIVVIGVDLPFGFSDLDQWTSMRPAPALVLGSKSHPGSRCATSTGRRVMSFAFRRARHLLLGISAADTQGSIIIDGHLAHRIQPLLRCSDYLVTTEIVAWAVRLGATPVEIPVDYPDSGSSTLSPIADGLRMFQGMLALRSRLHAVPGAAAPVSVSLHQSA